MTSLTEYINAIYKNMYQVTGNGSSVFNPGASNAIIACHKIMVEYAAIRRIKNLPTPIMVVNKTADNQQSFTQLRFNLNCGAALDIHVLYSIIEKKGLNNIRLDEFNTTLNMDVYS